MKIFAYVEDIEGRHREGQQLVSRYYNQLLGLESDPACKDESRLCYFSYSPNGYIASLYQAFTLEPLMRKEENSSSGNEKLPPFPSKTTLRKILLKTKSTSSFRPIFSFIP